MARKTKRSKGGAGSSEISDSSDISWSDAVAFLVSYVHKAIQKNGSNEFHKTFLNKINLDDLGKAFDFKLAEDRAFIHVYLDWMIFHERQLLNTLIDIVIMTLDSKKYHKLDFFTGENWDEKYNIFKDSILLSIQKTKESDTLTLLKVMHKLLSSELVKEQILPSIPNIYENIKKVHDMLKVGLVCILEKIIQINFGENDKFQKSLRIYMHDLDYTVFLKNEVMVFLFTGCASTVAIDLGKVIFGWVGHMAAQSGQNVQNKIIHVAKDAKTFASQTRKKVTTAFVETAKNTVNNFKSVATNVIEKTGELANQPVDDFNGVHPSLLGGKRKTRKKYRQKI